MSETFNAGPSVHTIPEGDDRPRLTCLDCGYIAYENPKIIVGAVCVWQQKFLMCKRAIEPRKGFWTFPAGYLELNETMSNGAAREAREEAASEGGKRAQSKAEPEGTRKAHGEDEGEGLSQDRRRKSCSRR